MSEEWVGFLELYNINKESKHHFLRHNYWIKDMLQVCDIVFLSLEFIIGSLTFTFLYSSCSSLMCSICFIYWHPQYLNQIVLNLSDYYNTVIIFHYNVCSVPSNIMGCFVFCFIVYLVIFFRWVAYYDLIIRRNYWK